MTVTNCGCGTCRDTGSCCVKYSTIPDESLFVQLTERNSSTAQQGSLTGEFSMYGGLATTLGLPPAAWPIDGVTSFRSVDFTMVKDPITGEDCLENRIRLRCNPDITSVLDSFEAYIINSFGSLTNVKWRLWVKINEEYTNTTQPLFPKHQIDYADGNNVNTTPNLVRQFGYYQWPYFNESGERTLKFQLPGCSGPTNDGNESSEPKQASMYVKDIEATGPIPWPTRGGGCEPTDTACLNNQECTWGKDPSFYLEFIKIGSDGSEFASGDVETWEGCKPKTSCDCSICQPCTPGESINCFGLPSTCPETGCGCLGVNLNCCSGAIGGSDWANYLSSGACSDFPGGTGSGCCCAQFIKLFPDLCNNMTDTCAGCACCGGFATNIGCGECDDDNWCASNVNCGQSEICCGRPGCNSEICTPDDKCWNGVKCVEGEGECESEEVNTYTCIETTYQACTEMQNDSNVSWTCFSGGETCQGGDEDGIGASCPCLSSLNGETVEENGCGCYIKENGAYVGACNRIGQCRTPINNTEESGNSCAGVNYFSFEAKSKNGFVQTDGNNKPTINIGTVPLYRNQSVTNVCNSSLNSALANWGHLDPCYATSSLDETCCNSICDGNVCTSYADIHPKILKACFTDNAFSNDVCFSCANQPAQSLAVGAFLNVTLGSLEDIIFYRDEFFAKLEARLVVNNELGSSVITTTNAHYSFPQDAPDTVSSWDDLLGANSQLFKMLPSGWELNNTERRNIFNAFSNLNSDWTIKTYCSNDASEGGIGFPFIKDANGWYNDPSQENSEGEFNPAQTIWLVIKSTNNKGIYKTRQAFNDCTDGGATDKYLYTIDHVYSGNSETERGYSDCFTQDGTNCVDDNSCKHCNPWRAAEDPNETKCSMFTSSPSAGDYEFPIRPYEYTTELWYKGVFENPCDNISNDTDVPSNFRLAAIVSTVPDCGFNPIDANDTSTNDTCSSYYYQCQDRSIKTNVYVLGPEISSGGNQQGDPWNKVLETTFEYDGEILQRHPGVDTNNVPRVINFFPASLSSLKRTTGNEVEDNIDFINPITPVSWNEDAWYNVDPRHNFIDVAKGNPQAAGRWTELPFKNYASEYLDSDKTTKGFYTTISAYHMNGITSVDFYLDGATTSSVAYSSVTGLKEHPLEVAKAQIVKDSEGNLLEGLQEYTIGIYSDSLSTGVHEIRAKILPKIGTARFLYGEPPTGDASVNVTDIEYPVKGSTGYQVISGSNVPFSKAQWPINTPDGPPIVNNIINESNLMKGVNRSLNNVKPNWGANNFWNMYNEGFDYYATSSHATSKTTTSYNSDKYVYGGTPQKELLLNGYESFWFNFNPTPVTVYVGQAGDSVPEDSNHFATSLYEAFQWLESNYAADNTSLHDAEIVLIPGTPASPRKYSWPNLFVAESLPSSVSWCQNALQKKSFVIRSENPDDKESTILWFPPSLDRVVMPWNNFALHVKDLTLYTGSQRGETNKTCLHSSGTNCRLLVENIVFASACSTAIKASQLVDSSGNVICGDTIQRATNGNVTGQLDYSKCQNINTTSTNLECAKNTSDCSSITCCGAKVTGGCQGCTGAGCTTCRNNCTCRVTEIEWWPFFSSNSFDMNSSGTSLEPVILCGNNDCTSTDSWACKGIFGSDIVTSSAFMCLGTQPQHCVILGMYNHELMDLAADTEWKLGLFGKDIECKDVPGSSLRNPVLIKHLLVDNYNKNLISDTGHGMIIDVWAKNADPYTTSFVPDLDIIKWDAYAVDQYSRNVVQDYNANITSPNPRYIKNFNCFIENRMMVNVKVDNCHGRVINMKGPDLKYRDFLSRADAYWNGHSGHYNNYGMPSIRNFVFKDVHINDKKESDQVFGYSAINHLYLDNFVISSEKERFCDSTDELTDTCSYSSDTGTFPLSVGNVDEQFGTYLHYGRKQIQNLRLSNCLFPNLISGDYAWDEKGTTIYKQSFLKGTYQNSIDWGTLNRIGQSFKLVHPVSTILPINYFWVGTQRPRIDNVRQQFITKENSNLLANAKKAAVSNVSYGDVVHKRISAPTGRTVGSSGCDFGTVVTNSYNNETDFKIDWEYQTVAQNAVFGPFTLLGRISTNKPEYSTTYISGSSFKTPDGQVISGLASSVDLFQYPSEAHNNFIAAAEGLSSGNILTQGIPNVGGILLTRAITKNYYHDICTWNSMSETCRKIATLDQRNVEEPLTKVTLSGSTYSWTTNTSAECKGSCVNIRDHYFVNNDNKDYRVDLDWVGIIDECTCKDLS